MNDQRTYLEEKAKRCQKERQNHNFSTAHYITRTKHILVKYNAFHLQLTSPAEVKIKNELLDLFPNKHLRRLLSAQALMKFTLHKKLTIFWVNPTVYQWLEE